MPKPKEKKDIRYFQASFECIDNKEAVSKESQDPDSGTVIKGYVSTSDLDRGNDIVDPQAFEKTIRNEYKKNPIVLYQHKFDQPIGKVTFMSIDQKGLYVEASIFEEKVEKLIKAGVLKTFSFGYFVTKAEYRDADDQLLDPSQTVDRTRIWSEDGVKRIIKELELYESSVVSVPMNPNATFEPKKAFSVYSLEKSVHDYFEKEVKKFNPNNPNPMPKTKEKVNLLNDEGKEIEAPKKKKILKKKIEKEDPEKGKKEVKEEKKIKTKETPKAKAPVDEKGDKGKGNEKKPKGKKAKKSKELNLSSAQQKLLVEEVVKLRKALFKIKSLVPKKQSIKYALEHRRFGTDAEKAEKEKEGKEVKEKAKEEKTGFIDALVESAT